MITSKFMNKKLYSILHENVELSSDYAKSIGDCLDVDWTQVSLDQFKQGLVVELEHGNTDEKTDITDDNMLLVGKIALAHLNEIPDYYTRLDKMEKEAKGEN